MGGYAVFLAPIAGILASDYWLIKKQNMDVPALYNPDGRYSYFHGFNWRAVAAMLISVAPNLPGLAYSIGLNEDGSDSVKISDGAKNLYTFDWLFGFVTSIVVYTALSMVWPARESLVEETIFGYVEGERTSDIESTGGKEHHGKDFGNVDAVDVATAFHTKENEK